MTKGIGRVQLLAVLAGAFGSLDTALNIAFPDLLDQFDLEVADLQWVVIFFVLTYGLSLMAAGRLADARGHARILAGGAVVAFFGLAVCAAAPSYGFLLAGRVAQGVGTAMVMAAAPAMVTLAADDRAKGRAVGIFQTSAAVGLAVGPLIGGALVSLSGWRSVFWFRLPLAIALLAVARSVQVDERTSNAGPHATSPPADEGLVAEAWATARRSGAFLAANTLSIVVNGAMFATWLLVPSLLVDELGYRALAGGALLAASPIATATASHFSGRLADQGAGGRLVVGGILASALGMGVMSLLANQESLVLVAVGLVLVGAGLGAFSVPNMATVMAALPANRQGVGAGLSLTTRTFGIVAGVVGTSRLFDGLEATNGFLDAYRTVFLVMAAILAVAGAVEGLRRVVFTP